MVPAGVSTEMLKGGGVSSLFLGIDDARFIHRGVLESPRARRQFGIRAASPVLDGRQIEITAGGRSWTVLATGEIPSRARAAGAGPELLRGRWTDSPADRLWAEPTQAQLLWDMDRFHLPRGKAAGDSTWAEWHYFNVVLAPDRWVYVALIIRGRVGTPGEWRGEVSITARDADGTHRPLTRTVPDQIIRFDTLSPNLHFGTESYVRLVGDTYHVRAVADGGSVDLRVHPAPYRYSPPADIGGSALVSGYVAPALYARAEGTVCLPRCEPVQHAQAYHDHNWGVWQNVSWEWGSASNERLSLLYGVVRGDSTATQGLFARLMDNEGVRGLYRPGPVRFTGTRTVAVGPARVRVPTGFVLSDPRRELEVTVDVTAAHMTDFQRRQRRYFVQMRGTATVRERGMQPERLQGFFETYVD
jgi:hypothetical protein